MEDYKQRYDNKGLVVFCLAGIFILFFILSFYSLNNVYGSGNGITCSNNFNISLDNDLNNNQYINSNIFNNSNTINNSINNDSNNSNTADNNIDNYNIVLENDSNYQNDSVQNTDSNETGDFESNGTININVGSTNVSTSIKSSTSSNGCLVTSLGSVDNNYISKAISSSSLPDSSIFSLSSDYSNYFNYNDNFFDPVYEDNYAFYTIDRNDRLEKIRENSIKGDNIDFNSLFSIFQYTDKYNKYDHDNVNDYLINNPVVILISNSDFKGTDLEKYNNFVNEISTINFNKIGANEQTSAILPFESRPKPILTVLFYITIFMEHHDNVKESSNSF